MNQKRSGGISMARTACTVTLYPSGALVAIQADLVTHIALGVTGAVVGCYVVSAVWGSVKVGVYGSAIILCGVDNPD
jgi:hypothetical protein